jgi:hypothetical protein
MRFIIRFFIASTAILLALQFGCREKSVEAPTKNPREYTWTVQEISRPPNSSFPFQVIATDVWGSSPRDVYVTFVSGATRSYKLFHFDGLQWSEVELGQFGSSQVSFDLHSVAGFGSSDVWAVGERLYLNPTPPPNFLDSSLIIHFNGSTWSEITLSSIQKGLRSIAPIAPNDIWFGGAGLSLYHYDGSKVMKESFGSAVSKTETHNIYLYQMVGNAARVYTVYHDSGYFHFLGRSEGVWRELNRNFASLTCLWLSPSGTLFGTFYGYGLYIWDAQSTWKAIYTEANASLSVYGSSENNIFVTGQHGGLYHYNGSDWFKYKDLQSATISFEGVWTDGKEVFVIGDDGFKSYIYHGK